MDWVLVICFMLLTNVATGSWNFAGVNVAKDKTTEQTPGTWGLFTSDLAVDGNPDTNLDHGSCAHTGKLYNTSATWTVYLNATFTLKGIRVFSRSHYKWRLENFKVIGGLSNTIIYDDETANPQLYLETQIDITTNSSSQFSSITIEVPAHTDLPRDNGGSILQLCEVLIFTENNDCPAPNSGGALVTSVRQGTGYWNTVKRLVSTWTVLDFVCTGYSILVGNENITCDSGGSYNAPFPACIEIQCSSPQRINNGYYTQLLKNRYSVGETVQWECDQGYTSEQSRTRHCMLSTYWSGTQPTCSRITCSFPGSLSNGDLQFNRNDYTSGKVGSGTSISIICDEGFRATVPEINCKDDGRWDNIALCIQVQCNRIAALTGGYYNYMLNGNIERSDKHVYGYGTLATAVCNETLYQLSMTSEVARTCGQNGHWTGHDALCDALCEAPSFPNGKFSGQNEEEFYKAGHSIIPTCLDGFKIDGHVQVSIQCQQNHTWYPAIPSCIDQFESAICPNLVFDEDFQSRIYQVEYKVKWVNIPTCPQGKTQLKVNSGCPSFNGSNYLLWTLRKGTGFFNSSYGQFSPGTVIDAGCKAGHILVGADVVVCLGDGSYSSGIPHCLEVKAEEQQVSCTAGIAGGLTGGIVLGAAIGIAVSCFVQRRKPKKGSPSTTVAHSSNPVFYSNVNNEHVYTELDRSAVQ